MPSNPNTEQMETMDLATAQRVEQEKMTRRAALRKLGFGAGMAAFALLGVDDFARMVGRRMERMAGDNKVAEQIAKEFQGTGIAFASYYPGPGSVPDPPTGTEIGNNCVKNPHYYGNGTTTCEGCAAEGCGDNYPAYSGHTMPAHDCTVTAQNVCAKSTD